MGEAATSLDVQRLIAVNADSEARIRALERLVTNTRTPIGGIIDYYGTTEPAGWLFPNGQAIPAQYTDAIAQIGANTPDLRGRATFGLDNLGGASDAARLTAANTLGGTGGSEDIVVADLPAHTHQNILGNGAGAIVTAAVVGAGLGSYGTAQYGGNQASSSGTGIGQSKRMPPYMLVNKLIRVA